MKACLVLFLISTAFGSRVAFNETVKVSTFRHDSKWFHKIYHPKSHKKIKESSPISLKPPSKIENIFFGKHRVIPGRIGIDQKFNLVVGGALWLRGKSDLEIIHDMFNVIAENSIVWTTTNSLLPAACPIPQSPRTIPWHVKGTGETRSFMAIKLLIEAGYNVLEMGKVIYKCGLKKIQVAVVVKHIVVPGKIFSLYVLDPSISNGPVDMKNFGDLCGSSGIRYSAHVCSSSYLRTGSCSGMASNETVELMNASIQSLLGLEESGDCQECFDEFSSVF